MCSQFDDCPIAELFGTVPTIHTIQQCMMHNPGH